jgi:hypothetical protein
VNLTTLLPLIVVVILVERALHARDPWPLIFWFFIGLVLLLEVVATFRLFRTWLATRRPPQ